MILCLHPDLRPDRGPVSGGGAWGSGRRAPASAGAMIIIERESVCCFHQFVLAVRLQEQNRYKLSANGGGSRVEGLSVGGA